ncbi:cupin domain-containing protein [Pueribacillus theae]|uniref:Cupin domain-containing protein n=1 Tax=Pueribacillus theae TaxID=2171751 RepID=A0A2U1JS02_9BACI|nr:cupin domain-containing protein [Pueribacillus theae]PWA07902.1 cupin domain-containing protein [Pueribacillus theae]
MEELKVRRVVTGHDENGNATIKIDDTVTGIKPTEDASLALVWSTDAFPSDNTDEFDGAKRKVGLTSPGGTVLRFVDFYPGNNKFMHRTQSIDYGIVIEGEIELELDNGVTAQLKAGEVVVQRGTIHSWNNKTDKTCRMAFVLIEAEKVKIGNQTLEPTD